MASVRPPLARSAKKTPPKKRFAAAAEHARLLRAVSALQMMGSEENLRLLLQLQMGPKSPQELAEALVRPTYLVSRRLARLARAGLVSVRHRKLFELRGAGARRLVQLACELARSFVPRVAPPKTAR